jgi:hypothetical protein
VEFYLNERLHEEVFSNTGNILIKYAYIVGWGFGIVKGEKKGELIQWSNVAGNYKKRAFPIVHDFSVAKDKMRRRAL